MLFKLRGTLSPRLDLFRMCLCMQPCRFSFQFNMKKKKHSNDFNWNICRASITPPATRITKYVQNLCGNNSGILFKLAVYRDIYDLLLKCDYIALQWAAAIWAIYKHWKMAIKVINGLHLIYECILALSSQSVYGINRNILIVPFSFDPTIK